tara:strand:- start:538 stop:1872 length:1335 start_codon:yes stop_codon:yes gene_type:complete
MKINQLPDIPREWGIKQIRHIFDIYNGSTPKSGNPEFWNGNINWITPDDLGSNTDKSITSSRRKITKLGYKSCGVSLAPSGSIALSTRAPIGHLAITKMPACVNQGCRILVPKEGVPEYWYYSLISAKSLIVSLGQGTTFMELPRQSLASVALPVPSIDSQKAIAHFLDHKTAQIDALIAKKQSLLDKLAEQRTALISQAVTKGLDPSVPMKDSGVDWLGKIPKYWHVSKLGYVAKSLQTGPFGSQLHADEYVEDGTPLINPSDISKGKITGNPTITVEDAVVARLSRHKLELGDIVIARRGEMGRAGLVGKGNVGWLCGTGSLRARLKKEVINPEFLLYQFSMRGVSEYLSLQSVGSTMDNLNTSILGRLWVVVPPLQEQNDIISEIQKVSSRIEKMRSSVTSAISKLQEYRSALITNAVTGKIDVRDFCIPTTTVQKEVAHG